MPATRTRPTLRLERQCWQAGDRLVCGIDEGGRGARAGPGTLPPGIPPPQHPRGIPGSKMPTPDQREVAAAHVRTWARAYAIGHATHEECDELGMTAALRAAGSRALAQLAMQGYEPDRVILDGNHDYLRMGTRVTTVIKGDATSLAVAAASCVAKVARDALMVEEAEHFPAYGFESNRGYPAPVHKAALNAHGPTTIHRRSWIFMDGLVWGGLAPPPGRLF